MDALDRFVSHVDFDGPLPARRPDLGRCHLWTASCFGSGYGQFKEGGKNHRAHRWLWKRKRGPLADVVVLDHFACDTPACVNLDHMRPATQRENVLRSDTSWAARNAAKTHCPQDHPYDEANTRVRPGDGARICLICVRKRDRERKRALRAAS